ncbi:MAG TPA: LbtU family siderophore porin [Deltaproteobacteria bacterium]|nr:LbtU family siderophore porin [Deltaproteobacteria bacterium]
MEIFFEMGKGFAAVAVLWLTVLAQAVFSGAVRAAPAPGVSSLEERIGRLERLNSELYRTLEEKKRAGMLREIAENVTVGGLVEVEAAADRNDLYGHSSDVVLATVSIGLDARINEHIEGRVLLLWEEEQTEPMEVDIGTVRFIDPSGASLTGGRMYLPFGVYTSHFISDPMTLELGETRRSALLAAYENDLFEVSAAFFTGAVDGAASGGGIDDFTAALTVTPAAGVIVGGAYISDLAETGADLTGLAASGGAPARAVAGYDLFLTAGTGALLFDAEYIGAASRFDPADLDADGDGRGDRPSALNVELAWNLREDLELAARYESSRELPSLPARQYGLDLTWRLRPNAALSVEYLHGRYRGGGDRDLVSTQLSIEF